MASGLLKLEAVLANSYKDFPIDDRSLLMVDLGIERDLLGHRNVRGCFCSELLLKQGLDLIC